MNLVAPKKQEVSVDALMARMRTLSQKQDECSENELNQRFKSVEMQVCIVINLNTRASSNVAHKIDILQ